MESVMTKESKKKWRPTYPIPVIIKVLQGIPYSHKKIQLLNMLIEDCKYNEEHITLEELEKFKKELILSGIPDAEPVWELPYLYDLLEMYQGYKNFETYRTYDYEPEALEAILSQIDSSEQKLNRLRRLKKDAKQIIVIFESDDIYWDVLENGGMSGDTRYPALNEFISEKLDYFILSGTPITKKAIQEDIIGKCKEYRRKLKWIDSEIEFWENRTGEKQKTMELPHRTIPDQFQIIANELQLKIDHWYEAKVKVKTKLANEIELIYFDQKKEFKRQYAKTDFVKLLFIKLKLQGEDEDWTPEQLYKNIK